jgi:hypothetical protein
MGRGDDGFCVFVLWYFRESKKKGGRCFFFFDGECKWRTFSPAYLTSGAFDG